MSGEKKVLEMLKNSLEFLAYFVHPNGTIGGEYGSRNTELYYPSGFEYLSDKIPEAASIAERFRKSIGEGSIHLNEMDIRNLVPFLTSYVLAFLEKSKPIKKVKLPYENEFEKHFPDAQLFVKSNKRYYAILGVSKGGVLKVYDKKKKELVYSECGYIGTLRNGKKISSQMLNYTDEVIVNDNKVKFETNFFHVPLRVMTPLKFFLFRMFNLTVGRSYKINNFIRNRFIVKGFIMPKKPIDLKIAREFTFLDDSISIEDTFINNGLKLKEMKKVEKFTTVFMASSKYYQEQDLVESKVFGKDLSKEINKKSETKFSFKITV